MKTNIKNIIVLMLAMLLVLGLTACGSKTSDNQTSTGSNIVNIPGTAEPRTDAPVDETPAAPADETPVPTVSSGNVGTDKNDYRTYTADFDNHTYTVDGTSGSEIEGTHYTATFDRETGVLTFEGNGTFIGFQHDVIQDVLEFDLAEVHTVAIKGDFTEFAPHYALYSFLLDMQNWIPPLETIDLSGAPGVEVNREELGPDSYSDYFHPTVIYSGDNLDDFAEKETHITWVKK